MFFRSHRNIGSDDNLADLPKGCEHKWKGFPLFVDQFYDGSDDEFPWTMRVNTKYVCVKCKDVREELLDTYYYRTEEEMDRAYSEFKRECPDRFQPTFIVNAMVFDEQLLDREYLDVIERANAKTKEILAEDLSKLLDSYNK